LIINKILVIQTAFIGDVILATALLEELHAAYPNAELYFLVRKGNESLFNNHPFLKETLVWDKKSNKISNLFKLLINIRKQKFDLVINCQRFASSGILAGFSSAKHIAGFKENPFSFLFNYTVKHQINTGKHEIERNAELIADFCKTTSQKPKLYPQTSDFQAVSEFSKNPYYCIAPASVWFTKQVPTDKWVELIQHLPLEAPIYLIGAPNDFELCEQIKLNCNNRVTHNLAGRLTFLQSCALLKNGVMNYVNDSAPMHLCSAVNANVTAIFLSTSPTFGFTPLSSNSHIFEVKNLTCKPCGLHGFSKCPQTHFMCGKKLDFDLLFKA
jgi:heptosyltransferase-2